MNNKGAQNKIWFWFKKHNLMLILIILGILLRIFFIPSTSGVDTLDMYRIGQEVIDEKQELYKISQTKFAWPPPYLWLIEACYSTWRHFFPDAILDPTIKLDSTEYRSLVTIFKIPTLVAEIIIGIIFYLAFLRLKEPKRGLIAVALWFFNPVSLLINTMWGKLDVISTMFVVLAAYFFFSKKHILSALALGLSLACNMWAVILIPVLFFGVFKQNRIKALGILLIIILPFILVSLPYLKTMPLDYLQAISGSKSIGEQDWLFGWRPPIAWFVPKPLTISIIFGLFFLLNFGWKFKNSLERFCGQSLMILAVFFVFSPYAPQFLIWFYPLLLLDAVNNYSKFIIFLGVTLAITGIFFFWGGQASLAVNYFIRDDIMADIIGWKRFFSPEKYNLIFESLSALFTGAMLSYILLTLRSNFRGINYRKQKT